MLNAFGSNVCKSTSTELSDCATARCNVTLPAVYGMVDACKKRLGVFWMILAPPPMKLELLVKPNWIFFNFVSPYIRTSSEYSVN